MCEKLIKSIKKLKEILGKDGEYSISRSDGEKMSLPEMIMVGNIFENIDNALDKIDKKETMKASPTVKQA